MITARYLRGAQRRRPVFSSLSGLGLTPVGQTPFAFSTARSGEDVLRTPDAVARQVSFNTPSIPQPGVMRTIYDATPPPAADAGTVGDEDTKTALFILESEADTGPHTFLQDEEGRYLDSEGRPVVDSISPDVAPQGGFLSTWGPPLLAVAGIGLAVWILRR